MRGSVAARSERETQLSQRTNAHERSQNEVNVYVEPAGERRPASLVSRGRISMPPISVLVSMLRGAPVNVWPRVYCVSRSCLFPDRAWRACEQFQKVNLIWAPKGPRQPAGLSKAQWRPPAGAIALRVSPAECVPFPRARTPRPGWWELSPRLRLSLPAQSSSFLAFPSS
jgi:hypothetical protein